MSLKSKLIILTAVMASLLEIIDTSIVNVAIPSMMGNLGATLEDISWVVTGYIIANAIVLPLSAWLGLQIGRKVYFTGCILLFTATSVACGFAPNLFTLTVFRIFQGLAGGALLPTSQTLIYEQFSKEKAGIGSAIFGMSVMIGPTIGPTLGGYLTDNFGWRMIFNINLPLGIIAALLAWVNVDDTKPLFAPGQNKKPDIDIIGLALLILSIGTLQYVLERGQADDWFTSKAILICTIITLVSIPSFIWWELRVKNPIVKISLFKEPLVRSGTMMMLILGFFLYGLVFVLPIFVGNVLHYDATQTGMLFIPGSLLTAMMMPLVGRMLSKVDPRYLIGIGFFLVECCLFSMTRFSPQTDERQIFWSLMLRGSALALLFVPINTTVLSHFKGPDLGQVAGLMNLLRQIGGSVGIAMIGTLLDRNGKQNYADIMSKVSKLSPAAQLSFQQTTGAMKSKMSDMIGLAKSSDAALKALEFKVGTQVFVMSFVQLIWVILIVGIFVIIPLVRLKKPEGPLAPVDSH